MAQMETSVKRVLKLKPLNFITAPSNKPSFNCSEVASVLGFNPYVSKNSCLVRVLSALPKFNSKILALKHSMDVKTVKEFIKESPPVLQQELKLRCEN